MQPEAQGGAGGSGALDYGAANGAPAEAEWLTAEEAADEYRRLAGVTREPRTIYGWMKEGRLLSRKDGRSVRTTRLWLADFVRRQAAARSPNEEPAAVVALEAEAESWARRRTAPTPEELAQALLPPDSPPDAVAGLAERIVHCWAHLTQLPAPMGAELVLDLVCRAERKLDRLQRLTPGLVAATLLCLLCLGALLETGV